MCDRKIDIYNLNQGKERKEEEIEQYYICTGCNTFGAYKKKQLVKESGIIMNVDYLKDKIPHKEGCYLIGVFVKPKGIREFDYDEEYIRKKEIIPDYVIIEKKEIQGFDNAVKACEHLNIETY